MSERDIRVNKYHRIKNISFLGGKKNISDRIKHMDRIHHEAKAVGNIVGLSNRRSGEI
jgi:hypothetical protein